MLLELLVDDWKVLPKSDIVDLNDLKHKDLLVIWELRINTIEDGTYVCIEWCTTPVEEWT